MPQAFPLQKVLEHRQQLEEHKQMELAKAEAHLAETLAGLRMREVARDAIAADLARLKQVEQLDVYRLQAAMQRHLHAMTEVDRARSAIAAAQAEVATARKASIAASQDRLVLDRLRDAHHLEIRTSAERIDAARLGELGLLRWHANREKE